MVELAVVVEPDFGLVPGVEAGLVVETPAVPGVVVVPEPAPVVAVVGDRNRVGWLEVYPDQATTAESVVIEGQTLADPHSQGTAEVAGTASRSDRALAQLAGVHTTLAAMRDVVVGVAEGMDQRVAAEGRC